MVAQLVHVWVVLGHDGDGVALLADDETSLLLRGVPQVDAIILTGGEKRDQGERFRIDGEQRKNRYEHSPLRVLGHL